MLDHEGKEVPGNRGYKYFGAAKDLPGVRELFEKERELNFHHQQKIRMVKPQDHVILYLIVYYSYSTTQENKG